MTNDAKYKISEGVTPPRVLLLQTNKGRVLLGVLPLLTTCICSEWQDFGWERDSRNSIKDDQGALFDNVLECEIYSEGRKRLELPS